MSSREGSQDLDFEDVIAQFERDFTSFTKAKTTSKTGFSPETEDEQNIIMDTAGLEPDLQMLCEAIMDHVQSNRRSLLNFAAHNKRELNCRYGDSAVAKEVFRAEIKATLKQMKQFCERELMDSPLLSSSERSSINSLKRQVRERDEQLATLRRKLKQTQIAKHRLEDSVSGYRVAFNEYEDANELLESEVRELRKQVAALTKRCSDADVNHRRDHQEREMLQATLAKFRQEVVIAHQDAVNARTEARHAHKHVEHLESRAAEARASTAAVSVRIKELKEIQEQMIATMRGVDNSGDATAARRVLENLGEQRSRLIGKIANLLVGNRKSDENPQREEHQVHQDSNASATRGETPCVTQHCSGSVFQDSDAGRSETNGPDCEVDGLNKKQRFESIRRFGNELTRRTTGRYSRKVVMANVEKTCEAVERDTETLREVIVMKENELGRMEEELAEANDRAATFEMALQKERQKKMLENRNMRNPAMEKAKAEMRSFTTSRRKKSTLFDWQNQTVKAEEKEEESEIEYWAV